MMERRKNLNDKFGFVEIMEYTSIGESCSVVSGGTPSRSKNEYWENGNIPWIKIGNIKSKYVNEYDELITEQGLNNSSAKLLKKGTILYTIFATLGEVGILDIEACTNQAIAGINITNPRITTDYLYYYLKSKKDYVNNIGRGVAQNNINLTTLKNFEIPLIDVDKQLNIVEILEKVERMICLKEKEIDDLDLLIKARFIEMFGRPFINNLNWESKQIKNVVNEVKYGTSKPSVENGEYKYLRMNNLTYDGRFDLTDLKFISLDNDELEKCVVRKGDVLFNRTNSLDLIGKTAEFDFNEDMVIAGYIIRIRLKEAIVPKFFSMYMNTDEMKLHLRTIAKGAVNQANINAQELQEIPIYLPPIELQNQFVNFVRHVDKSRFVELLQDHGIFDLSLNTDEMDTYYNEFLEQVQDQKQEVIDNQEIILTLQDTSLLNVFHEKTNEEIHNELEKEISEMFNGIEGEDASKLYDSLHNQIQYA